jgi:cyanophycinase
MGSDTHSMFQSGGYGRIHPQRCKRTTERAISPKVGAPVRVVISVHRSLFRLLAAVLSLSLFARAEGGSSGPEKGSLLVHGGGRLSKDAILEFIKLAGGPEGPFIIIPTALEGEDWGAEYVAKSFLVRAGAKNVSVVHTRDRKVADTAEFVAPLTKARGVWLDGGRQWRFADSYLGTRVVTELQGVLARGGVIGGSSAGATIQGSYLVRGAVEGNQVMMAKGHEEGFGFLKNVAVDQHVIARKRETDMGAVVAAHPELLGLGLDENTAIVVQGQHARVLGASKLIVTDPKFTPAADGLHYFTLSNGEVLDLATRRKVEAK